MTLTGLEGHRFSDEFLAEFELLEVLGSGVSGVVVKARQRSLARTVAIKVLNKHTNSVHNLEARFTREARVLAALNHPNIVKVFDYGIDSDAPYLVQEFLDGCTLEEQLNGKAELSIEESMVIMKALAKSLAHAHENKVVHRDVKPANIFYREDDSTYILLDFGFAISDEYSTAITRTGFVVGTPIFMAPEQIIGIKNLPATDIYAAGTLFFRLLAGTYPLFCRSASHFKDKLTKKPESLAEHSSGLPDKLVNLVDSCLAVRAAERPATGAELLAKLEDIEKEIIEKEERPVLDSADFAPVKTCADSQSVETEVMTSWRPVAATIFLLIVLLFCLYLADNPKPKKTLPPNNINCLVESLYPTELSIILEATPKKRATVIVTGESGQLSKTTHLVDIEKVVRLTLPADKKYKVKTLFAGNPPTIIERTIKLAPVASQLIGLSHHVSRKEATFWPRVLYSKGQLVIPTKKQGMFCVTRKGRVIWEKLDMPSLQTLEKKNDTIIAVSRKGEIFALSWQSGDILWKLQVPEKLDAEVFLSDELLLIRKVQSGYIFALRLEDGSVEWEIHGNLSDNWSLVGDTIATPLNGADIATYSLQSGLKLKTHPSLSGHIFSTLFKEMKDKIYVGILPGALLRGTWESGFEKICNTQGDARAIAPLDSLVFVLCKSPDKLLAINGNNGELVWDHKLTNPINYVGAAREAVFVGEQLGNRGCRVRVFHSKSGRLLTALNYSAATLMYPTIIPEGLIVGLRSSSVFIHPLYSP